MVKWNNGDSTGSFSYALAFTLFFTSLQMTTAARAQDPYGGGNTPTSASGNPAATAKADTNWPACDSLVESLQTDYCYDRKGRLSTIINKENFADGPRVTARGRRITAKTAPLNEAEFAVYKSKYLSDDSGTGGSRNRGRKGLKDRAIKAEADFDALGDFCQNLPAQIEDQQSEIDKINKQIKDLTASLDDAKKDEADARRDMFKNCRGQCIQMAFNKDPASDCSLLATPDSISAALLPADANNPSVSKYGQGPFTTAVNQSTETDPAAICGAVIGSIKISASGKDPKGCAGQIIKNGNEGNTNYPIQGCPASSAWFESYNAYKKNVKDLADAKVKLDTFAVNSETGCKLTSVKSFTKKDWKSCSTKCLETALDSCADVLADAEADAKIAARGGYCPSCSTSEGGSGGGSGSNCQYGACVSHTAQIIAAAGGALGSLTPLGLGVLNAIDYSKGMNTCAANYAAYLNVQTNVGIAPSLSNCGVASALGGFAGGMGVGAGAFSPFGIPAISQGAYPYGVPGALSGGGAYNPLLSGGGMFGGQGGANTYANSIQRQQMLGIMGGAQQLGQYTNYGLNQQQYGGGAYNQLFGGGYGGGYGGGFGGGAYNQLFGGGAFNPIAPSAYYGGGYGGGFGGGYGGGFGSYPNYGGNGFNLSAGINFNTGGAAYSPGYNSFTPYIPYAAPSYLPVTSCTVGQAC